MHFQHEKVNLDETASTHPFVPRHFFFFQTSSFKIYQIICLIVYFLFHCLKALMFILYTFLIDVIKNRGETIELKSVCLIFQILRYLLCFTRILCHTLYIGNKELRNHVRTPWLSYESSNPMIDSTT